MLSRIIVPLDGSALAERALDPALRLARRRPNAQVTLLRVPVLSQVLAPAEGGFGMLVATNSVADAEAEAARYLAEIQATCLADGCSVRSVSAGGDVPGAIVDCAAQEAASLIVMSSHGYSGLTRWLLGSVAEKVLHAAPCPVLVIRSAEPIRRVLVPLDGSPLSERALEPALTVAQALEASVTLLRVVPDISPVTITTLDQYERGLGDSLVASVYEEAEGYLRRLAERPGDAAVDVAVSSGPAPELILGYAERHGIDMIAMATHGRTGLRRWLYGSVTDRVLHQAPVSMLVVRPPARELAD
jgi:nucleotide-binding universal stress UspA family protein